MVVTADTGGGGCGWWWWGCFCGTANNQLLRWQSACKGRCTPPPGESSFPCATGSVALDNASHPAFHTHLLRVCLSLPKQEPRSCLDDIHLETVISWAPNKCLSAKKRIMFCATFREAHPLWPLVMFLDHKGHISPRPQTVSPPAPRFREGQSETQAFVFKE